MNENLVCNVFKLHSSVSLPVYGTENSACFDISYQNPNSTPIKGYNLRNKEIFRHVSLNKDFSIMPGDRLLIPTSLIFDLPSGYSLRLHPRSGHALKKGLIMANCEGVIDSDYVQELFVMLTNISENAILIEDNERLAQGELVPNLKFSFVETREKPTTKTNRIGGFGSTGEHLPDFLMKKFLEIKGIPQEEVSTKNNYSPNNGDMVTGVFDKNTKPSKMTNAERQRNYRIRKAQKEEQKLLEKEMNGSAV